MTESQGERITVAKDAIEPGTLWKTVSARLRVGLQEAEATRRANGRYQVMKLQGSWCTVSPAGQIVRETDEQAKAFQTGVWLCQMYLKLASDYPPGKHRAVPA